MAENIKKKDNEDEEFTDLEQELWDISSEIFDEEVWNAQTKEDMKDLSKREMAKVMFSHGFIMHQKIMDHQIKHMEDEIKKNPKIVMDTLERLKKQKIS